MTIKPRRGNSHQSIPIEERFWAHVDRQEPTQCWNWTGSVNPVTGYGTIGRRVGPYHHKTETVHRLAYVLAKGPIPDGLTINHLCRNRRCVNPAHLDVATARENILHGESTASANAAKTHCPRGHEYTAANTYHRKGGRVCKVCEYKRVREWKRRKRLEQGGLSAPHKGEET